MTVTIKQAWEQGSIRIAICCANYPCHNRLLLSIRDAIKQWGEDKPLNEIAARCTKCGSRDHVSVRGEPPGRVGKRGNR